MSSEIEKNLTKLYADRLKDKRQSRTKRRIRIEAGPQPLGIILPRYFNGSPQTLSKIEETRALISWEKYVGEAAATHSQAVRLRAGTLTVRVTSPIWMTQLSLLKNGILKKYKKDFPRLRIHNVFFIR
ncbi:MAG: DUF721 domain-containing protein [Proteobacteria bacterium]|nr:DUF721 domain-containing protein [Pseudomonadota bacterium]